MRSNFDWKRLCRRFTNGGAKPDETNPTNGDNNNSDEPNEPNKSEKTFTQADVNRMMKAEKEKGRRSILSELGIEDVADVKKSLEEFKKYQDSQKTELQKATDELKIANDKIANAEARALKSEYCLKAISFGANPESVEDLVSIVVTKISEDKDIETVLKEMKENKAYSGFFNTEDNANDKKPQGTGNPVPNNNKGSNNGNKNYGAQLAEARMKRQNINNNGGK